MNFWPSCEVYECVRNSGNLFEHAIVIYAGFAMKFSVTYLGFHLWGGGFFVWPLMFSQRRAARQAMFSNFSYGDD